MNSFVNKLSNDYVNFEKCGDVVVSPKDNMIGMFCHFCCDLFTNLPEFMHHLQEAHNDVLGFTSAYNVYSIEELMGLSDEEEVLCCSSSSAVSVVDKMEAQAGDGRNPTILNSLSAYETKPSYGKVPTPTMLSVDKCSGSAQPRKRDVLAEVEAMLFEEEQQAESQQENHDGTEQILQEIQLHIEESITTENAVPKLSQMPAKPHHYKFVVGRRSAAKTQPTCDLRSYAIARSARKREQQRRLASMKKRIFRSLENDQQARRNRPVKKLIDKLKFNELEKLIKETKDYRIEEEVVLKQLPKTKSEESAHTTNSQQAQCKPKEKISAINKFKALLRVPRSNSVRPIEELKQIKNENDVKPKSAIPRPAKITTSTEPATRPSVYVSKVEYLPKLDLKQEKSQAVEVLCSQTNTSRQTTVKATQPKEAIDNLLRKSTLTVVKLESTAAVKPRRRSSLTAAFSPPKSSKQLERSHSFSEQEQMNLALSSPKNTIKRTTTNSSEFSASKRIKAEDTKIKAARSSLNFDLSDSVVEFLQTDLKTSKLDTDSLLELAEPSQEAIEDTIDPTEATVKDAESTEAIAELNLRSDLTLLQFVGLPVLKYPHYEDLKPVEFVDVLRSKAAKFCNMLRGCETILNAKRYEAHFAHKLSEELALFAERVNSGFRTDLNVSELKRILNIVNAWHTQLVDCKFFRKATVSATTEHYLKLFAFLPKINRCVFYCEWCEENSGNKTRYEKHRLTHSCKFNCPHCDRGFKKRGYLVNHLRSVHGKAE
ncbi:hypothetical protein KR222_006748 [Zaprionus bogoriensis]|nr:hypothetical protein KR222_006748 [Zaprionus bogoriensis]